MATPRRQPGNCTWCALAVAASSGPGLDCFDGGYVLTRRREADGWLICHPEGCPVDPARLTKSRALSSEQAATASHPALARSRAHVKVPLCTRNACRDVPQQAARQATSAWLRWEASWLLRAQIDYSVSRMIGFAARAGRYTRPRERDQLLDTLRRSIGYEFGDSQPNPPARPRPLVAVTLFERRRGHLTAAVASFAALLHPPVPDAGRVLLAARSYQQLLAVADERAWCAALCGELLFPAAGDGVLLCETADVSGLETAGVRRLPGLTLAELTGRPQLLDVFVRLWAQAADDSGLADPKTAYTVAVDLLTSRVHPGR